MCALWEEIDMKKIICALLAGVLALSLCACARDAQAGMSIAPTAFSEETMDVLKLLGDDIQFYDLSLDGSVKSFALSLWVYRDGEWFEDGKMYGGSDTLGRRIAIRQTETGVDLYNISETGREKCSYQALDTPFEESLGIAGTKIDGKTPIELNRELPIWVKVGTTSNQMEVLDITQDFREMECNAGIAVTLTLSDEVVE